MIVLSVVWFIFKFLFLIATSAFVLSLLFSEKNEESKYFITSDRAKENDIIDSQRNVIIFIFIVIMLIVLLEIIELGLEYLLDLLLYMVM